MIYKKIPGLLESKECERCQFKIKQDRYNIQKACRLIINEYIKLCTGAGLVASGVGKRHKKHAVSDEFLTATTDAAGKIWGGNIYS